MLGSYKNELIWSVNWILDLSASGRLKVSSPIWITIFHSTKTVSTPWEVVSAEGTVFVLHTSLTLEINVRITMPDVEYEAELLF
jgi:hypothetical protein